MCLIEARDNITNKFSTSMCRNVLLKISILCSFKLFCCTLNKEKMNFLSLIITLITFANLSSASKILILFPSFSKSHTIVASNLASVLVESEHEVTLVTPFPENKKIKNYREIACPFPESVLEFLEILSKPVTKLEMLAIMPRVFKVSEEFSELMINMPEFQKLLKEESFDLVVIGMFMQNFLLGFGHHFQCPTIMLSVNAAFLSINRMFGNPLEVNAVPSVWLHGIKMNFLGRLTNFLANGMDLLLQVYVDHHMKTFYEWVVLQS
jgi:glucuronosyltransferase